MKALLSCLLFAAALHADTISLPPSAGPNYTVYTLDSDEDRQVMGFDSQGNVVLGENIHDQECITLPCYTLYSNGKAISLSLDPPVLVNDHGASCGPHCVRNGNLIAYEQDNNLYTPLGTVMPGQGTGVFLYLNSEGDILWNDPRSEFWFEAIDPPTPTPESGTLLLLAVGLTSTAVSIRFHR